MAVFMSNRLRKMLMRTNIYYPLKRAYKYIQILFWQLRAIVETRVLDKKIPAVRKGNIAMFHAARSGSTVLADLLGQHPKIFWDGEIYTPYSHKWKQKQALSGTHDFSDEAIKLLRKRMTFSTKKLFYGFEVGSFNLRVANIMLPDYIRDLDNLGVRHFIILERKNLLRKHVSNAIHLEKFYSHLLAHEKNRLIRIILKTRNLIESLQNDQNFFWMLSGLLKDKKVLKLTYEDDILHNPLKGYRRICNFLDIEYIEFPVRFKKTNPFKLSEIIINFAEVKQTLRETPFEWMLYD